MNRILEWFLDLESGHLAGVEWSFSFIAEYDVYLRFAMVLVVAAMVYLTVRSYRREGDAPPKVKAILSALRIAVVLLAFVVLLRPAIVLHYSRTLYSTVVLLFDDSLSMSFQDAYAGQDVRETRERTAAAMGVDEADLAAMPRIEVVRRIFEAEDGPLARLRKDHHLVLFKFSTDSQSDYVSRLAYLPVLDEGAEASGATRPALSADPLAPLRAQGYETRLASALRDWTEEVQGRRIGAVVLVSDGRNTTASDRLADARRALSKRGHPVLTVVVGDPTPPTNLTVTSVKAPREVRRGTRTEFVVTLTSRNLKDEEVLVELQRRGVDEKEWSGAIASRRAKLIEQPLKRGAAAEADTLAETRGVTTVVLDAEPETLGEFIYRAVVEAREDEQDPDDNAAETMVKVSDEKIKILLISGDGGKEFQFLRNYLFRQSDLYRLSVWQQNADAEVNQSASTGMKISRLPRTLRELAGDDDDEKVPGYDVVILYDPQPTEKGFDKNFAEMLRKFVRDLSRGVCFIASNKYTEQVLRGDENFKALAEMMPVQIATDTLDVLAEIRGKRSEAHQAAPTAYGADHPVMRLADSAEDNRGLWRQLPGIYWSHPVYKVKAAARVLAINGNPTRQTAKRRPEPLVAVQPYGSGRSLYVGFDETWRWRFLDDSRYYRVFWGNVIRYLASLKARRIVLTAGGDRFHVGQEITVKAEAFDEKFNPLDDETLEVDMTDTETGEAKTLLLEKVEGREGQYELACKLRHTGTFELTALRDDPRASEKVAAKRFVVTLPQAESQRPNADPRALREIASEPANALGIWQADEISRRIPRGRRVTVKPISKELWDKQLMLWAVVILLAVEWILRKKYNMA